MYVDSQLEFSNAQAVTATALSTNVVDLQPQSERLNALQNIGIGEDAYLVVQTQTAATDSGSDATLTVTLESADDAGISTNAQVHFSTGAIAFANFAPAGSKVAVFKLPQHLAYRRFLGVRYTVASGPLTAGNFDAFITKDVQAQQYMKPGYTTA